MADLAGLVQRLEVAVGRLESMSSSGGGGGPAAGTGGNNNHFCLTIISGTYKLTKTLLYKLSVSSRIVQVVEGGCALSL